MAQERTGAWECGECSRSEDDGARVEWVCHHCGKLLCRDHRLTLPDAAFSGPLVTSARLAVHCLDCRAAFHRVPSPRWWRRLRRRFR